MQAFRKTNIKVYNKETQRNKGGYIGIKPSQDKKRIVINFPNRSDRLLTKTGYIELVVENNTMVFREATEEIGFKITVNNGGANLAIKNLELEEWAEKFKGKYKIQTGLAIFTSEDKFIKGKINK